MSIIPRRAYDASPRYNFNVWDPYYHHDHHFGGSYATPHSTNYSYEITPTPLFSFKTQWKETPEAHMFEVELPGLTKDEVKVELEEGNVLRISGEKIIEKEQKSDHWYHVQRSGGKFVRSFKLPDNAKAKNLRACMENGVLTITVPKKEIKQTSKTIHVY